MNSMTTKEVTATGLCGTSHGDSGDVNIDATRYSRVHSIVFKQHSLV